MASASLPPVFDDSHYASSLPQKLKRALELGPRYYLWDLPRYYRNRSARGLSPWDTGAFFNPLKEFRKRGWTSWPEPPHYREALEKFAAEGIVLALPQTRLEALLAAWWRTRNVPGDVIECGAYLGATSLLIALLGHLNGVQQKVLILDTFRGMPAGSSFDLARQDGEFRPADDQADLVRRRAKALGVDTRVEIHQGLFRDTFTKLDGRDLRFSFVHIDANIYQGTLDACIYTIPRLAPDGIAVFDDYNAVLDLGARLAIDEYFAGKNVTPKPLATCSAYLLRESSK